MVTLGSGFLDAFCGEPWSFTKHNTLSPCLIQTFGSIIPLITIIIVFYTFNAKLKRVVSRIISGFSYIRYATKDSRIIEKTLASDEYRDAQTRFTTNNDTSERAVASVNSLETDYTRLIDDSSNATQTTTPIATTDLHSYLEHRATPKDRKLGISTSASTNPLNKFYVSSPNSTNAHLSLAVEPFPTRASFLPRLAFITAMLIGLMPTLSLLLSAIAVKHEDGSYYYSPHSIRLPPIVSLVYMGSHLLAWSLYAYLMHKRLAVPMPPCFAYNYHTMIFFYVALIPCFAQIHTTFFMKTSEFKPPHLFPLACAQFGLAVVNILAYVFFQLKGWAWLKKTTITCLDRSGTLDFHRYYHTMKAYHSAWAQRASLLDVNTVGSKIDNQKPNESHLAAIAQSIVVDSKMTDVDALEEDGRDSLAKSDISLDKAISDDTISSNDVVRLSNVHSPRHFAHTMSPSASVHSKRAEKTPNPAHILPLSSASMVLESIGLPGVLGASLPENVPALRPSPGIPSSSLGITLSGRSPSSSGSVTSVGNRLDVQTGLVMNVDEEARQQLFAVHAHAREHACHPSLETRTRMNPKSRKDALARSGVDTGKYCVPGSGFSGSASEIGESKAIKTGALVGFLGIDTSLIEDDMIDLDFNLRGINDNSPCDPDLDTPQPFSSILSTSHSAADTHSHALMHSKTAHAASNAISTHTPCTHAHDATSSSKPAPHPSLTSVTLTLPTLRQRKVTSWLEMQKHVLYDDDDGGFSYMDVDDVYEPAPGYSDVAPAFGKNTLSGGFLHANSASENDVESPLNLPLSLTCGSSVSHAAAVTHAPSTDADGNAADYVNIVDVVKATERRHWRSIQRVYAAFDGTDGSSPGYEHIPDVKDVNEQTHAFTYDDDVDVDSDDDISEVIQYISGKKSIKPKKSMPFSENDEFPNHYPESRSPLQARHLLPPRLKSSVGSLAWPWEFHANYWEKITFSWINPLLALGRKQIIELSDLDYAAPYNSSMRVLQQADHALAQYIQRNERHIVQNYTAAAPVYRSLAPNATNTQDHSAGTNCNSNAGCNASPTAECMAVYVDDVGIVDNSAIQTLKTVSDVIETNRLHEHEDKTSAGKTETSGKSAKDPENLSEVEKLHMELSKLPGARNPLWSRCSVLYIIWTVTSRKVIEGCLLKLFGDLLGYLPSIFLNMLITYATDLDNAPFGGGARGYYGFIIGGLLVMSNLAQAQCLQHSYHLMIREGARARHLVVAMIYRKVLSMSSPTRDAIGAGQITNIMTTDSMRVDLVYWMGYYIIFAPIQCIGTVSLLLFYLGFSSLVGVLVLVIMLPIQLKMSKVASDFTAHNQQYTDKRVSLTLELLNCIRVIKAQAWEDVFLSLVLQVRKSECWALLLRQIYNSIQAMVLQAAPSIVSTATFFTYSLAAGEKLTPAIAFTSLTLFNMLQVTLWAMPYTVQYIIEFTVAIQRIATVLTMPDKEVATVTTKYTVQPLTATSDSGNSTPNPTSGAASSSDIPRSTIASVYLHDVSTSASPPLPSIALHLHREPLDTIKIGEIRIENTDFWVQDYTSPNTTSATVTLSGIDLKKSYSGGSRCGSLCSSRCDSGNDTDSGKDIPTAIAKNPIPTSPKHTTTTSENKTTTNPTSHTLETPVSVIAPAITVPVPTFHVSKLICKPGSLNLVVGGVGSGKSFLLQCILGEIASTPSTLGLFTAKQPHQAPFSLDSPHSDTKSPSPYLPENDDTNSKTTEHSSESTTLPLSALPHVPLHAPICRSTFTHPLSLIAYVPQSAWIFAGTVRDNIVLDAEYIPQLFAETVAICGLSADIENMPQKDLTKVGEKGSTLSGGQKQRINIARAVYRRHLCSIFLFDAPLAALDAHVGTHIYNNVLGPHGVLKNKTRVIVSHQLDYAKDADQIIVMQAVQGGPELHVHSGPDGIPIDQNSEPPQNYHHESCVHSPSSVTNSTINNSYIIATEKSPHMVNTDIHIRPGSLMLRISQAGTFSQLTFSQASGIPQPSYSRAPSGAGPPPLSRLSSRSTHIATATQPTNIASNNLTTNDGTPLLSPVPLTLTPSLTSLTRAHSPMPLSRSQSPMAGAVTLTVIDANTDTIPTHIAVRGNPILSAALRMFPQAPLFADMLHTAMKHTQATAHATRSHSQRLPDAENHLDEVVSADGDVAMPLGKSMSIVGDPGLLPGMLAGSTVSSLDDVGDPHDDSENEDFDEIPTPTAPVATSETCDEDMDEEGEEVERLMISHEETRQSGQVPWATYYRYLQSMHIPVALLCLVFCLGQVVVARITDYWLSAWSADKYHKDTIDYVTMYAYLQAATVLANLICNILCATAGVNASKVLYQNMLVSVLNTSVQFFDITPIGRITNRFNSDMSFIDSTLAAAFFNWINLYLQIVSFVIMMSMQVIYIIPIFIPVAVIFMYISNYFKSTCRELRLLEAVSKSPIYIHFDETLDGIIPIRCYNLSPRYLHKMNHLLDDHLRPKYLGQCLNRWLAVRLDALGAFILICIIWASLAVGDISYYTNNDTNNGHAHLNASLLGLVVGYALTLTSKVNWLVRGSVDTENQMNSVTRVFEYSNLRPEAASNPYQLADKQYMKMIKGRHTLPAKKMVDICEPLLKDPPKDIVLPPALCDTPSQKNTVFATANAFLRAVRIAEKQENWPTSGKIVFRDVKARYRPELPLVLRGVNLSLPAGTKIAIVGRTGAGKSSILQILLRIVDHEATRERVYPYQKLIDAGAASAAAHAAAHEKKHKKHHHGDDDMNTALLSADAHHHHNHTHNYENVFAATSPLSGLEIDEVDISTLPLRALRKHVCIIPQDPTVFSQSIRFNLSPESSLDAAKNQQQSTANVSVSSSQHVLSPFDSGMSEIELLSHPIDGVYWKALEDVKLLSVVASLPGGLDYQLKNPQDVFSQGQRQLLCMARALVRKCKIVMLDECTASVDAQTDNLVQELIHRAFKDSTVITIAHRINTVLDYDSVVVMRMGRVVEVGHPRTLLRQEGSKFRALAMGEKS